MKRAWIPEGKLWGYNSVVTEKSQLNLPTDEDREKQQALPPGSATPNAPRKEADATVTRELPYSQFTKPDETSDINDRPRTIGVPGGNEDEHPYKNDYGYVRRRVMARYERRVPWERQKKQNVWTRLEDKREYQQNKSKILPRMKRWYKTVRNNSSYQDRREKYKDNPTKYKRQKVGYTPRHHQRGLAKRQRHQHYMHNRSRAKLQSHKWYQRNKHKPQFKRKQHLRHQFPHRYHLRYASEPVSFVVGPTLDMGYVIGIQNGMIHFDIPETVGVVYMHPLVFVHSVVFLGEGDIDRVYAMLDQQEEVYGTPPDKSDVEDVAILHGMDPVSQEFKLFLIDTIGTNSLDHAGPDDLLRVCDALVKRQTVLSDSIERVAGAVMLYDQRPPESDSEKRDVPQRSYRNTGPDEWTNVNPEATHAPTPADMPSPDPIVPGSGSGKVIPETLKPYG